MEIAQQAKGGLLAVQSVFEKNAEHTDAVGPDATELLMGQHREVETLFQKIQTASKRAVRIREGYVAQIEEKLTVHAKIEEQIFYPAVKEVDENLVLEAFEEHEAMRSALQRALDASAKDETFDAKITVLKEIIEHHVKEEETELFPKVRSRLPREALLHLGERMQRMVDRDEEAPIPITRATKKSKAKAAAAPMKKTSLAKRAPAKKAAASKAKPKTATPRRAPAKKVSKARAKAKPKARTAKSKA